MNKNLTMEFDQIENKLISVLVEISKLSQKRPDHAISEYKLEIINKLLEEANNLFTKGNFPMEEFSLFRNEDLPTFSDVVFELTLDLESMDYFRFQNSIQKSDSNYWRLDDNKELKTKSSRYAKKL